MSRAARRRLAHRLGRELLDVLDPQEQLTAGLAALLRVVPGEVAAEVELDVAARTWRVVEVPDLLLPLARASGQEEALLASPALPHLARRGRLGPSRGEELGPPEAWACNPMRRHLLEPAGVPHSLLVGALRDGVVHGWGVNRGSRFTDDELDALAVLEPYLRLAAAERSRAALVAELDHAVGGGAGLLLFRGETAVHVNAAAAELIERHAVPAQELLRLARDKLGADRRAVAVRTRRGVLRLQWRPARP
ncbi:hypothetical protein, partial [Kineococcus glutinatus]|uniref:hypothetical protein n=1 Tax=Kineococcus glutinatus TaxID=1070872 RepID=UPI0031EC4557